ncbi:hypothetical protein CKO25_08970 [Thiocapsa imhoffii]|uniref:Lipoprotein n=1 Tax=Thiocapsa imhoffii TaxID=382777 RepID=A0A9X1B906_9GAMM|nr:hypothetical protein [Thiocapsa imhoffii]MBK1644778.1 hypothetical protein [Thiocapsa imhoffii]
MLNRPSLVVFAWILTSTALLGCGPVYRTQYSYQPPTDANGRQCITQCAAIRELCRATMENRAAQERAVCQQTATLRYATCLATAKSDAERNACTNRDACRVSANTDRCDSDYNQCYQNCGGLVESTQVCVSGC